MSAGSTCAESKISNLYPAKVSVYKMSPLGLLREVNTCCPLPFTDRGSWAPSTGSFRITFLFLASFCWPDHFFFLTIRLSSPSRDLIQSCPHGLSPESLRDFVCFLKAAEDVTIGPSNGGAKCSSLELVIRGCLLQPLVFIDRDSRSLTPGPSWTSNQAAAEASVSLQRIFLYLEFFAGRFSSSSW
jgi:hypothetical protein